MAYTFIDVASAFHKTYDEDGNAITNGFDYQSANELLKRVADTGEGRIYINESGELVYESRFHREV
jgi:hypothetical protein